MNTSTDVYYTMRGAAVVIHNAYGIGSDHDVILDEANLIESIKNVRNNRPHYATESAWQNDLSTREGALSFLRHVKSLG